MVNKILVYYDGGIGRKCLVCDSHSSFLEIFLNGIVCCFCGTYYFFRKNGMIVEIIEENFV